jgi:mRNA-degrading endonuclease YafQ of YafQ-DinJ toxin-antitoxin module
MKLITTKAYERKLKKFRKQNPHLRDQYVKTISLLGDNPYHPSLRLHRLKGKLQKFYSISINLQYRIVIDFIIKDDTIILINIGGHDEVY